MHDECVINVQGIYTSIEQDVTSIEQQIMKFGKSWVSYSNVLETLHA